MNSKTIQDFLSQRKLVEESALESAKAEAELVAAKEDQERKALDDGEMDPAALWDLKESARKRVGTAEIVANRAASKLRKAESDFTKDLQGFSQEVTTALHAAASEKEEALTAHLQELIVPDMKYDSRVNDFAKNCAGVRDRRALAQRIGRSNSDTGICAALEAAIPFFEEA